MSRDAPVDARRGFEGDDAQLLEFLEHLELPVVLVATKLDKLPASKRKPRVAALRKEAGGARKPEAPGGGVREAGAEQAAVPADWRRKGGT